MFNLASVTAVKRVNLNEYVVTYGTLTLVIKRIVNGWSVRFHVVVKGINGCPDMTWNDDTATQNDKHFWQGISDMAYDQHAEAMKKQTILVRAEMKTLENKTF